MFESITIITHEYNSKIRGSRFFLSGLIETWEQQGVRVYISAGCHYIPADIAILHVDTTQVGDEYLELAARYPVAINFGVKDISKSGFSRHLLKTDDLYQGPVIVKTDANFGGIPEGNIELLTNDSKLTQPKVAPTWQEIKFLDSNNYPIFNGITDVPHGVWDNPHLIVEKFLPERLETGEYKLRTYLFFGDQEIGAWYISPDPIIKFVNSTSRGLLDTVPESLREIRKLTGFEFGRFDYTVVDEEIVLFDMNKTPAVGPATLQLMSEQIKLGFANAVYDF